MTPRIALPRIGLGCAAIGNLYEAVAPDDASATVHAAYDGGIRLFDTAPLYGHGLSEERLGVGLSGLPRDQLIVCTKVGRLLDPGPPDGDVIFADIPDRHPVYDYSGDGVRRSLEASLDRLQLDRVDVVHVHDPDHHADQAVAEAFPALIRLRDEGVIRAVGCGMNQAPLLTRFVREVDLDCVLLAGRYTLLDQSGADELLPLCEARGVAVIAAGVFNSGLLADPDRTPLYDYGTAPPALLAQAQALAAEAREAGTTLKARALNFPFSHPAVSTVLVGARSPAEVRECLDLLDQPSEA